MLLRPSKLKRAISLFLIAMMLMTCNAVTVPANTEKTVIAEETTANEDMVTPSEGISSGSDAYEGEDMPSDEDDVPAELDGIVVDNLDEVADPDTEDNDLEEATYSDTLDDTELAEIAGLATDSMTDEEEKAAAAEEREKSPLELGYIPGEIVIEYDSILGEDEIQRVVSMLDGSISSVIME